MSPEADPYDINLFEEGIQEDRIEVFVSSMAMMEESWCEEDLFRQIPSWWPSFKVELKREQARDGVIYILTMLDTQDQERFKFSGPQNTVNAALMTSNVVGTVKIADLVIDSIDLLRG